MPTTFDLQLHSPLELHDVEVEPEEIHPQSEKVFKHPQYFLKNYSFDRGLYESGFCLN